MCSVPLTQSDGNVDVETAAESDVDTFSLDVQLHRYPNKCK